MFQRILALQPDNLPALEGREDALSDLLLQARTLAERGELAEAAALLRRARQFDAGHADLPASEEALARAADRRLRQAQRALRRQQLEAAAKGFRRCWWWPPMIPMRSAGVSRPCRQWLHAARSPPTTSSSMRRNVMRPWRRSWGLRRPSGNNWRSACSARSAAGSAAAAVSTAQRERQLRDHLRKIERAERAGQWISPPGHSAFDALREAQSLAPRDARVKAAAARLLPASRRCFDDNLRQNRVQAAGACLQAWQTLSPTAAGLPSARLRLAQRWLAIGSERLGNGDLAFAAHAAEQARLLQPDLAELPAFEDRLRRAGGRAD